MLGTAFFLSSNLEKAAGARGPAVFPSLRIPLLKWSQLYVEAIRMILSWSVLYYGAIVLNMYRSPGRTRALRYFFRP